MEKYQLVAREEKERILLLLEECGPYAVDGIVARELVLRKIERTFVRVQGDESRRLSVTISKVAWEKLERAGEILSHKVPDGALPKIIEEISSYHVEKNDLRAATSSEEAPPRQRKRGRPRKSPLRELPRLPEPREHLVLLLEPL